MTDSYNIRSMTEDERALAIEKAEIKRLQIIESLEEKVSQFAKLSGKGKLGKRKFAIGKGPHDWKKKNKL